MELLLDKFGKIDLNECETKIIDNCSIIDYKIENEVLNKFSKIMIKNKNHSFPKKKETWLNYIDNLKDIIKLKIEYEPESVLLHILYKYHVYSFEKQIYDNVLICTTI